MPIWADQAGVNAASVLLRCSPDSLQQSLAVERRRRGRRDREGMKGTWESSAKRMAGVGWGGLSGEGRGGRRATWTPGGKITKP